MFNFRFNWKKLLLITGVIVALILIVWLIWRLFNSPPLPQLSEQTALPDSGQLPTAPSGSSQIIDQATGPDGLPQSSEEPMSPEDLDKFLQDLQNRDNKITDLSIDQVSAPTLTADGGLQYYNRGDSRFYRLQSDGTATPLTDDKFFSVQNITWSPNNQQAVLEYPDNSKIIYNFETKRQISLPQHWQEFSWSPQSDRLIFKSIGAETENRWLAVVQNNGAGAKQVEPIGVNADKVIPSWSPNNQIVAMMSEGLDFDRKTVYFIGLNGENFKSMTTQGRGFIPLWSPQGDKLLYSVYSQLDDYKPTLWIANASGEEIGSGRAPLELQTWADKCVFASNSELYCAAPKTLQTGAGMFPNLADNTADDLYYLNLNTNTKTLISQNNYYNMTNLVITADQRYLYFTDKQSGRLHRLNL